MPAPVPSTRYALAAPDARYNVETAGVDRERELAADVDRPKSLPLRYAVERPLANVFFAAHARKAASGATLPTAWRCGAFRYTRRMR